MRGSAGCRHHHTPRLKKMEENQAQKEGLKGGLILLSWSSSCRVPTVRPSLQSSRPSNQISTINITFTPCYPPCHNRQYLPLTRARTPNSKRTFFSCSPTQTYPLEASSPPPVWNLSTPTVCYTTLVRTCPILPPAAPQQQGDPQHHRKPTYHQQRFPSPSRHCTHMRGLVSLSSRGCTSALADTWTRAYVREVIGHEHGNWKMKRKGKRQMWCSKPRKGRDWKNV